MGMEIDLTPYKTFKETNSLKELNQLTQSESEEWKLLSVRTKRWVGESGEFEDKHTYLLGSPSKFGNFGQ